MALDTKEVFSYAGFPDHLASDEEKNEDLYGLQMAKAIEYEWFYRPESGGNCTYYDKRDKYHNLRLYGRGEQPTDIYKKLINGGEDSSYTNYDWRPLQIIPNFVKSIVNKMTERLFSVKAEATDKYSTDLKDTHRKHLEKFIITKPIRELAKKTLGVDLSPQNSEEFPDSMEEVDLFMKLKYKPAIEIASEEAIKYTLDLNDYDEIQTDVITDITTIGLGCVKHGTDPSKGITIDYVDPADMVYSYPTSKDFKNVHYYGEVKRITINELRRLTGERFTKDELKDMASATSEWTRYHGANSNEQHYREDDMQNTMVDVLFFNFKSTNTISYKKKYNKNGGFKMTKKNSDFKKHDKKYSGYDASKKIIDVWYEGGLVLGTNKLFNYKLCENMIRKEGFLNKTSPNYLVYAPEIYQNRTKSTVETVIPYVDQMQQIHIKLQQIIAKARPNGIYIDVAGLNELEMGDGNTLTPLEAIKIYDDTGNVLGSSTNYEGEYNYGKEPIRELKNGVIDGLDRLIGAYNHYLNLVRDSIGIPQGTDASSPHPKMAVGVMDQLASSSNTATRHILNGGLNISERLGESLALRIKDIFLYSDIKKTYINAIGSINVDVLKALKTYHLHDLGIAIELKPDEQERQYLEQNINQALAKELITLDDAIDIRNISNIKLANELIKSRRVRRDKEKKAHEMKLEETRGQAQVNVVKESANSKKLELKFKTQSNLAEIEAKSKAKMNELSHEAKVKGDLMKKEFEYNMTLKGVDVDSLSKRDRAKEDRKDSRQDKGKTDDSKMIEQRTFNKPSLNFESSNDNLSGNMELSEQEPK